MRLAVDALPLARRTGGSLRAYIVNLAAATARMAGDSVDGALFYAPRGVEAFPAAPMTRTPTGFLGGSPRLWERFKLADAVFEDKADMLFCPGGVVPPWSLTPVATLVHDASALSPPADSPAWRRALAKRLPFAIARSGAIVTATEEIGQSILAWNAGLPAPMRKGLFRRALDRLKPPLDGTARIDGLENRITVIPWAAEDEFSRPLSSDALEAFRQSMVGGSFMLAPAMDGCEASLEVALSAWFATAARLRRDDALIVLAGCRDRRFGRFADSARKLGVAGRVRIAVTESTEAAAGFFRAASVILVPENRDTGGLSLLRAIASGTPTVAGGFPQPKWLPNGAAVHWISDLSVKSWHEASVAALAAGGRSGRYKPETTPSWDRHVKTLFAVLAESLRQNADA
ncbi:MAG: glycosyltransferase [Planctomycetota bacterium]|nr:glycosyltransferase [Planctomycetota bacterium]